ncbi:hypothetical protein [Permianibacter aggregans]|uniref:Uncharacterized protein n=1 Tax=Permianibacter aggregans TaxID=1510150 RepID=A0A4R6UPC5_9GAMM|nr:hypothetical protein [Permianibacter aggregans]QGX39799.1 hypothetical protein E2H98_09075 [Permianibacter aggregans]TDQ47075.1 hypothetical protein EV696_1112 [Permianibacter aggregans]
MNKVWQLDKPEWVKRRKAMWLATKEYHDIAISRAELNARKAFFLTGAVAGLEDADEEERIWTFIGEDWERFTLLPRCDRAIYTELLDGILEAENYNRLIILYRFIGRRFGRIYEAQQWFGTEFGYMDGMEREFFRYLLPERFDNEKHQKEVEEKFVNGRTFLSPLQVFDLLVDEGFGFLTHSSANPHHPIQDLVDYWASAMPYFSFSDKPLVVNDGYVRETKSAEQAAKTFCQAVRFFEDPRDYASNSTLAMDFRNKIFMKLEQGTGCKELDDIWQWTAGTDGRQLGRSLGHSLPKERLLFNPRATPKAIKEIQRITCSPYLSDYRFNPNEVRLVEVSEFVDYSLRVLLGYVKDGDHNKAKIPAYHYKFRLPQALLFNSEEDLVVDINFLWLIPKEASSNRMELVPKLVLFYSFPRIKKTLNHNVLQGIKLRRLFWQLRSEHNLPLSTVGCGSAQFVWPDNTVNIPHGSELYSSVGFESAGIMVGDEKQTCKESADAKSWFYEFPDYKGDHPFADLDKFLKEVLSP